MKMNDLLTNVTEFANKNSPAILAGMGVAGVFATGYMFYKASPRAHDILDYYNELNSECDLTKEEKRENTKEMVKEIAPIILPPIAMAVATSAAIIGSNRISAKRIAVLSAAYSMSSEALKDIQEKIHELDPKKAQKIKESHAKDVMDKYEHVPDISESEIFDGDVLCLDEYSGQKFRSNAEKIGRAILKISQKCANEMYVSLNEFYDEINSPDLMHVPMGDSFGWTADDIVDGILPIGKTACLSKSERPLLVVTYYADLRPDYANLHR